MLQLIHSELEGVAVCLSDLTLQVDRNQLDFRIQVGTKGEAPIGGLERPPLDHTEPWPEQRRQRSSHLE